MKTTKGLWAQLRDGEIDARKGSSEYTMEDLDWAIEVLKRQKPNVRKMPDMDMDMVSWVADNGEDGVLYPLGPCSGGREFCKWFLKEFDEWAKKYKSK